MVFSTSFNLTDKIAEVRNNIDNEKKSASELDATIENMVKNINFETVGPTQWASLYVLEATLFAKGIQDVVWKRVAMKLKALLPFQFPSLLKELKPLIFSYLSPTDLREVSKVNKEFKHLADEAKIQCINQYQQPLYTMMRFNLLENLLKSQGHKLKYFNFSSIDISYYGELFFQLLSHCPNVTHLNLKECKLSDDDVDKILGHSKITVLNLSHNSLTPKGIQKLVQAELFPRLVNLNLSHNHIGDNLASQIIEKGENLETLILNEDLSSSGKIGKKTAYSVAECLQFKKLKHLSLENNQIDSECINRIISSSGLGSLESLSFSSNPIKHEDLSIPMAFTTPDYVYYELKNSYQNWIRIRFNHQVH